MPSAVEVQQVEVRWLRGCGVQRKVVSGEQRGVLLANGVPRGVWIWGVRGWCEARDGGGWRYADGSGEACGLMVWMVVVYARFAASLPSWQGKGAIGRSCVMDRRPVHEQCGWLRSSCVRALARHLISCRTALQCGGLGSREGAVALGKRALEAMHATLCSCVFGK